MATVLPSSVFRRGAIADFWTVESPSGLTTLYTGSTELCGTTAGLLVFFFGAAAVGLLARCGDAAAGLPTPSRPMTSQPTSRQTMAPLDRPSWFGSKSVLSLLCFIALS